MAGIIARGNRNLHQVAVDDAQLLSSSLLEGECCKPVDVAQVYLSGFVQQGQGVGAEELSVGTGLLRAVVEVLDGVLGHRIIEAQARMDAGPLTELGPPEQPIYLTRVELELTRFSHHVDLRLIEGDQLPSSIGPDGRDECGDAWTERQSEPLLTTEDNSTPWDFSDASLVTSPSHWLMIKSTTSTAPARTTREASRTWG